MAARVTSKAAPFIAPLTPFATAGRVAALAAMALAAGCAGGGSSVDVAGERINYEDAIEAFTDPGADPNGLDPVAAAAYWSVQYDRDPSDWRATVKYSAALRKIGSLEQSVKVMHAAVARHGDNPAVGFEMGKTLIENGRAFEAVRYLEQAVDAFPNDWRVLSAYGVALDQIGEHERARANYEIALTIAPNAVQILNNKGLSYAMSGNLSAAIRTLRTAASSPGADARIRQNLALALAIKGDLREAERLARSDLPPQIADRNIDFLRTLVAQPAYWQDYAAGDFETSPFDEAPIKDAETANAETASAETASAGGPSQALAQPGPQQLTEPEPATEPAAPKSKPTALAPEPTALREIDDAEPADTQTTGAPLKD